MYGEPKAFLIGGMLFVYILSCMAYVICIMTSMKLMTGRFDAWMERLEKREEEFFRHQEYVIRKFLIRNRTEMKDMCITEYNEAETMKMFKEEGRREGEDKLGKLVSLLILGGRTGDAQRAAANKEERVRLYKEFNII